jgi:hypothetical protein
MEITMRDVFNLQEGLKNIVNKELPIKVAFKLQQNIREVEKEYKIGQDLRSQLIQKYKEKDLDNGKVKLKKDKLDVFQEELDELLSQKITIGLKKINLDELNSIQATPRTLGLIHIILFEGGEK